MEAAKTCLVINSSMTEKLSLDGPALRIRMQAQSARLFPLRRLSRIHIIGELERGFDALIHCAEHQIPVAFFTARGKLRCQLYFPVFENTFLNHWLEHIEFDMQARQEYQEWLVHQTLYLLSRMGYAQGTRERRLQIVDEELSSLCRAKLGEKGYRLAMEWLQGILAVQLSQIIVDQGLSNQSRGKRKLMEDLSPLYDLWLRHHLAEKLGTKHLIINANTMADFYQGQSEAIEYSTRRMLAQLATRLESIV